MKEVIIVTFAYEESGGTRTVIEGLAEFHKELNSKVTRIIITSPSYKDEAYRFNHNLDDKVYLNTNSDFDVHRTYSRLYEIINSHKNLEAIYFIMGHPFCLHLSSILPSKIKKLSVLYFLDPWFVFNDLKSTIRNPVKGFIEIRDKILLSLETSTSDIFRKTLPLDSLLGNEVNTKDFFKEYKSVLLLSKDMYEFFRLIVPSSVNVDYIPLYFSPVVKDYEVLWTRPQDIELIYTGRVTSSWKGFGLLLEALQILKRYKLHLYTWDKNEVYVAKKLIHEYKLNEESVIYKEKAQTEDFLKHMAQVTNVMIPSIAEGFSYTMLESMSVGGVTTVGPIYGGPRDVILDGFNGVVYSDASSESMAKKILKTHSMSNEEINAIRHNAVQSVEKYTFEKYKLKLQKFLGI